MRDESLKGGRGWRKEKMRWGLRKDEGWRRRKRRGLGVGEEWRMRSEGRKTGGGGG